MSKRKLQDDEKEVITIGISGKIGSGKSTLAVALKQCCEKFGWLVLERNFADKLKELVAFFYEIDISLCYSQDGKNTQLPIKQLTSKDLKALVAFHFGLDSFEEPLNERYGKDMTGNKMLELWQSVHLEKFTETRCTVGQALQNWGTALRNVDSQLWIKSVADFVDKNKKEYKANKILFIIPDTRFENEAEYIRSEMSGFTIRLNGDPGNVAKNSQRDLNHISETALDNYQKFAAVFDTNVYKVDYCVEQVCTML